MGKSFEERLNQGPEGDRADYKSGAGATPKEQARKEVAHEEIMYDVQRSGAVTWSEDRSDSKSMNRWSNDENPGQDAN